MDDTAEKLVEVASSVYSGSSNERLRIFRDQIPSILESTTPMSAEAVSVLIDIIFSTLSIYDDRGSKKAVDDVITKALREVLFMKTFATTVVQAIEKQVKVQSHVGCHRLLKWYCLLTKSQFASLSKNAVSRVVLAHSSLFHILTRANFLERKACKKTLFHMFAEAPEMYMTYIEELRHGKTPYKDSPEMLRLLLEFSSTNPSLFCQWKPLFLDMYVSSVLKSKNKPAKILSEAFIPLFTSLTHEDLKNVSLVKMLERNTDLLLESVGILLDSVNLDLSKYAIKILEVVLPTARHADEGRRAAALSIVKCVSQKSNNPDNVKAIFASVQAVIGGSEGTLAFPHQKVGMMHAIQELSNVSDGKYLSTFSETIGRFLLLCHKDDGNFSVHADHLVRISTSYY